MCQMKPKQEAMALTKAIDDSHDTCYRFDSQISQMLYSKFRPLILLLVLFAVSCQQTVPLSPPPSNSPLSTTGPIATATGLRPPAPQPTFSPLPLTAEPIVNLQFEILVHDLYGSD